MESGKQETWLALRAQAGDREAFDRLFRLLQEPLYRYIFSLVGARAPAEDVLQEVFILIYRKIRWLREPELLRPWVYRIATREAFKHLKRERRWTEKAEDESAMFDLPAPSHDEMAPESGSNRSLALAYLYSENLRGARAAAETARQYNEPEYNHCALALLGLIALRQGDATAAQEAFAAALSETGQLLSYTAQNIDALYTIGLALCGLALCDGVNRTPAAIEAYGAARAINKNAGIVARVLRLFDALAVVDSAGVLKEVRAGAAGELDQNRMG